MSGPGKEHERLVAELDGLAVLAGYSRPLLLPPGVRPDVARQDTAGHRFVGDAKSTELPTCAATFRRLARYARYMAYAPRVSDVLAIALPGRADHQPWLTLLIAVVSTSGREVATSSVTRLDRHTLVLHVLIQRAARVGRPVTVPITSKPTLVRTR